MELLNNFYVDDDNRIQVNKRKLVIRNYHTTEKDSYDEKTYYVNEASYIEWTEQLVPKHQLLELISDEALDTSVYTWMIGIKLKSDNLWKEIEEIASYGSKEAYEASLPAATDEYLLALETEIALMQLGISGGDLE